MDFSFRQSDSYSESLVLVPNILFFFLPLFLLLCHSASTAMFDPKYYSLASQFFECPSVYGLELY